jgi:hypothetical protein
VLDSIALIPHPMRNFASQTQNFVKDSIAPIPHPMRNFASQTPNFVKNMLSLAGQAQTDSLRIKGSADEVTQYSMGKGNRIGHQACSETYRRITSNKTNQDPDQVSTRNN